MVVGGTNLQSSLFLCQNCGLPTDIGLCWISDGLLDLLDCKLACENIELTNL